MKNLTLFLLLFVALESRAEIHFLKGPLAGAVEKATAESKPVMIDFITDWCRWCDTLDKRTYSDEEVAAFVNARVVPIKIDAEKGEGIAIAKKYGVTGYPTILLMHPDGEEIDRLLGYKPPDEFLTDLSNYVEGKNTMAAILAELKKKPDNTTMQYALARKYTDRNDWSGVQTAYTKVLELDPSNALGHREEAEYYVAVAKLRSDKDAGPLTTFVSTYPSSDMVRGAVSSLIRFHVKAKDADATRKVFETYIASHADDRSMMNNYAWSCAENLMNLEHAATVAARAVTLATDNGEKASYIDTQATAVFGLGKIEDAIRLEEQALTLMKDAPPKDRKTYEDTLAKFKAARTPASGG